jgi:hypothetical protein
MRSAAKYVVLVFLVQVAMCQTTTTGALSGVVVDQTEAVIPDSFVEIVDVAKGSIQSAKTDRLGVYQFSFLRPGIYKFKAGHPGFQEAQRSVQVQVGPSGTVNIKLRIANTSSRIDVLGEAQTVQADNADVSTTITQRQVSEVPNPGNDITYIAQTTPGAIMNTDGGGWMAKFSILGMPGISYAFTVDGMSITENTLNLVRGGSLGLTLGTNQIEEATVVTSAYSGQFGNTAGGNINYVSKSGGNDFHGNAEYFWNGTALNANDWFNEAAGNPRPFSIANQWAASFGGPIRKERVFFFFDTEGLQLTIPQILFTVTPTPEFEQATIANIDSRFGASSASDSFYKKIFSLYDSTPGVASAVPGNFDDPLGCAGFVGPNGLGTAVPCARHLTNTRSRPSQDTLLSGRVDWNFGHNDRAFVRLQEEGGRYAQSNDPISSAFDADYDNSRWQGQFLETHTFGAAAANQFFVGIASHYWAYRSTNPDEALNTFPTQLNFYVPGTFTTLGGFNSIGRYTFDTNNIQISDDVVKVHGKHKLGIGLSFDRERWLEYSIFDANGELNPQTMQAFYQGGYDPATLDTDFTTLIQAFSVRPKMSALFGGIQAYAQDDWRARKNLVLTLAIRAEHRSNFSCQTACFSRLIAPFDEISHNPSQPYNQVLVTGQRRVSSLDAVDWSPRVGFAWQPFGVSHESVLRGGAAILYDPFQEALAEEFYLNAPNYNSLNAYQNNLSPGETASLFKDTAASNAAFLNGYGAGATLQDLQNQVANFVPPWIESIDPKMHRPQYRRWNVEWQQRFGAGTFLSLGYFGHHGIHELLRNPNANAYGFGSLPAGPCTSPPVPPCSDPRFGEVEEWASRAVSNYNGLVASFRHHFTRLRHGIVELNYTYGHAFDEVSNGGIWNFTQGSTSSLQDPKNIRAAYGPAEYDVRHSMNASYVWELPLRSLSRGRGPTVLLNDWQVSGTLFARTGFPYTVFDRALSGNLQQNNYFGQIYAVPVGPIPKNSSCGRAAAFSLNHHPCLPRQFSVQADGTNVLNPSALFVQATCETGFNSGHMPSGTDPCGGPIVSFVQGRNHFRAPSYFNADFTLMKVTQIPGWQTSTLALGFQFFNILNHPNFGTPDNISSDPTFGLIFYGEQGPNGLLGAGNNGSSRMIQLKAELRF